MPAKNQLVKKRCFRTYREQRPSTFICHETFFIHAGFHKTASCSFQTFLACNRDALCDAGVYYPDIHGADCHNALARMALEGDWQGVESHVRTWKKEAGQGDNLSVLISAEDFETFICEPAFAKRPEDVIGKAGFMEITWPCVVRNPWDYFNSIYAEHAKHHTCLNHQQAAEEILQSGTLQVRNRQRRWIFAFDYAAILKRFQVLPGSSGEMSLANLRVKV